jgi:hypothetical protein
LPQLALKLVARSRGRFSNRHGMGRAPARSSHSRLDTTGPDWQFFIASFAVSLADGTKASGLLMRRKRDGRWEYRPPTPEEEENYVCCEAW